VNARVRSFLYFFLTVAAVVVTLGILNWLPLVVQKETLRPYGSVDEVRSKLNRRDLRVPSYFPQNIAWPPATVLGQAVPYPAVVMVFNRTGGTEHALVVAQAESDDFSGSYIRLTQVKQKVAYPLKGRQALLEVGNCGSPDPCSRLSWREGRSRIELTMKASPVDLVPIAESMLQ
jgi:hypothetical protein